MLIEIEGNELTGKTTLCKSVRKKLGDDKCVVVKFPNRETPIGEKSADIIDARRYSDKTEFFAMIADFQFSHETIIEPALHDGKVVLLDRARGSTEVYQYELLSKFRDMAWSDMIGYKADWTFLLDADVNTLFARRDERADLSSFDQDNYAEFQLRRTRYLEWAYRQSSTSILDATAPTETLVKCVTHIVEVKGHYSNYIKFHRNERG